MKVYSRRSFIAASLAVGVGAASLGSVAYADDQVYPRRAITIVVPHVPGGSVDSIARLFADKLKDELKQSVVVENRAGASGMIGAGHVARAQPDGYTLYINASIHNINPLLYKDKMQFDAVKDFTAVSMLAQGALIFAVNPKVPAKTVPELVKLVQANPDKYNFVTSGFGSAGHLGISQFLHQHGLSNIPVILYKGAAPALQDVVGGQATAIMDPMLSSRPFVESGQLRALAVTGKQRSSLLPDVPTAQEAGMKGFEMYSWYGLWGPANLPEPVVKKLEAATQKIMVSPEMAKRLETLGFEAVYRNSSDFQHYINAEMDKYKNIISTAGITVN